MDKRSSAQLMTTVITCLFLFSTLLLQAQPIFPDCSELDPDQQGQAGLFVALNNPACAGEATGSIILDPNFSGPNANLIRNEYIWGTPGLSGNVNQNLPAGDYKVTINYIELVLSDGTVVDTIPVCQIDTVFTLREPNRLIVENCAATQFATNTQTQDGVVQVRFDGGTAPYNLVFQRSGGAQFTVDVPTAGGRTIDGLAAGSYRLSIIDANDCIETCDFEIGVCDFQVDIIKRQACEPDEPTIFELENQVAGTTVFVNGDPTALENNSFSITAPGIINVSVQQNTTGCTSDTTIVVDPINEILLLGCEAECPASDAETNDGSARVQFVGGIPPYRVVYTQISTGAPFEINVQEAGEVILNNLANGTYRVTIFDSNECSISCDSDIEIVTCDLDANIATTDVSCTGDVNGRVEITPTAGTSPYQITFDQANIPLVDGVAVITGVVPGGHTVVVTDACACSITRSITINEPTPLVIETAEQEDEDDQSPFINSGKARIDFTGGTAPFNLTLDGEDFDTTVTFQSEPDGSTVIDGLPGDGYLVNVTDANGCEIMAADTLFIDQTFTVDPGLFVVFFEDTDTKAEVLAREAELRQLADSTGANLIKQDSCNCSKLDSLDRLQLWSTNQLLEINTNSEQKRKKGGIDTTELEGALPFPIEEIVINEGNENCIEAPEQGGVQKRITIAVVDSGIEMVSELNKNGHPTLINLDWTNFDEPVNNQDDDINCAVDDVEGYDFRNNTNLILDDLSHGTHIAGIIASNKPGWLDIDLINLKIFAKKGGEAEGNIFDLMCALHYAVNNDTKVINLSLGYEAEYPSMALYQALRKARAGDAVIVVSAGNDGKNLDNQEDKRWPGAFQFYNNEALEVFPLNNIITVAGLTSSGDSLDIEDSNYGVNTIDIAAPSIFKSTIPGPGEETLKGTSMSAAYMTRVVALLRAYNEDFDASKVIATIKDKANSAVMGSELLRSGGKVDFDALFGQYEGTRFPPIKRPILIREFNSNMIKISGNRLKQSGDPLIITFTDQEIFMDDVVFEVTDIQTNQVVYRKYYCTTNRIEWLGIDDYGNPLPPKSQAYEYEIQIQGETYKDARMKVVVAE